jgi:tetratricopeptide (TPR) repeat protein
MSKKKKKPKKTKQSIKTNWCKVLSLVVPSFLAGAVIGAGILHFSRSSEPEIPEIQAVEKSQLEIALEQVQKDPNNDQYYNNLGCAYLKQKNYEEAESAFRRALEIYPSYEMALSNMMNLRVCQNRFEEAMEFNEQYAHLQSNCYEKNKKSIVLKHAEHLFSKGRLQDAEKKIDEFFILTPKMYKFKAGADFLLHISTEYYKKDQYLESIRVSKRLLTVVPEEWASDKARIHSNIAMAYTYLAEQKQNLHYLLQAKASIDKAYSLDQTNKQIVGLRQKYEALMKLIKTDSKKN